MLYESPKKKLNSTLESTAVSQINIHGVAQHSRTSNAKGKLKKVLNVYKENISAAYNVSDIEIEEPPPIINLEMAKIPKEKGFNDMLPVQKLCRQCVTKYEKLTKLLENENIQKLLRQRVHNTN